MRTIPLKQLGEGVKVGDVVTIDDTPFKLVAITEGETLIVQTVGKEKWEHIASRETFGQGWEQLLVRTQLAHLSLAQAPGKAQA
ncbi:MAG TPA: hypothetical protein VFK80_02950 [Limnochordia bacterium]|nr:hypothetical protein [Limnochordia bacterium]